VENSRIEQIKAFLKDSPDDSFLNYALAIEMIGQQNTISAIAIFEKLLDKDPNYSATYYQYGKLVQKEGNSEKAKQIFENGIKIAVNNKETHTAAELRTALNELLYDED
jgi:tetratricopeptide (TPR) repeat protein